ncbi:MAG: MOSC domain-containing protein, partial [Candidatus Zixiibacteriota bacterium]
MHNFDDPGIPSVYRLSVSAAKGMKKQNVSRVTVTPDGIEGDAHAGTLRAISLLPYESFEKLAHHELHLNPGDFGENITTIGVDFKDLSVGTRMTLGDTVIIEVIQIGKDCHNDCTIKQTVG